MGNMDSGEILHSYSKQPFPRNLWFCLFKTLGQVVNFSGKSQVDLRKQLASTEVSSKPLLFLSGLLYGTMTMELGGKVTIDCEKTNHRAELEFKLKVRYIVAPFWVGLRACPCAPGRVWPYTPDHFCTSNVCEHQSRACLERRCHPAVLPHPTQIDPRKP